MRGEAVCPLLLCAGPDQPQQPWGEDKVFVAHRRPRAAPASPAPASGTPTEHVLASTGCHPGLRGAVHYYSFFFFPVLGSVKSLWVFLCLHSFLTLSPSSEVVFYLLYLQLIISICFMGQYILY